MNCGLRYMSRRESLFSPDLGEYESYGIVVLKNNMLLLHISDVSVDESFVSELALRCTSEQLDPIHFYDVIEDALNT